MTPLHLGVGNQLLLVAGCPSPQVVVCLLLPAEVSPSRPEVVSPLLQVEAKRLTVTKRGGSTLTLCAHTKKATEVAVDLYESFVSDKKTLYSVVNEDGEKTTITLEKFTADILQAHLPNVHAWVQQTYDRVVVKKPDLSRRRQGDLVRILAAREAATTEMYKAFMRDLL